MKIYDAYFTYAPISSDSLEKVKFLAEKYAIDVIVDNVSLEFSYSGKDYSKSVVAMFVELAAIIGSADGEMSCQFIDDDKNDKYDFYQIEDGKLVRQHGWIVRGERVIVGLSEL